MYLHVDVRTVVVNLCSILFSEILGEVWVSPATPYWSCSQPTVPKTGHHVRIADHSTTFRGFESYDLQNVALFVLWARILHFA